MKYMKLSSLLVLSLLLFAPAAVAAVECDLNTESRRIRMESMHEKVGDENGMLRVTCTWTEANIDTDSTFDLELNLSGNLSTQGDDVNMKAMLTLMDADGDDTDSDPDSRTVAVESVGRDSLYWEDVPFPTDTASWAVSAAGSGSFTISGIYIDATSVDDTRLEATIEMVGNDLADNSDGTSPDDDLTADADEVNLNRVDQALALNFAEDNKANSKVNACVPGKFDITVELEEGFRMGWMAGNDIELMVSSGGITAKDQGDFDVIERESGGGKLTIDVDEGTGTDSGNLKITFAPAAGGEVGDDIMLNAMILPASRSDEKFAVSDTLVVGTYVACTGDDLLFPIVMTSTGWDTGIAILNDSKVAGSCSLNWGNMDLDDDEMEALSTIEVKSKQLRAFLASSMRNDYMGSLGVHCTFAGAHGYALLSDNANSVGQGYVAPTQ